jgi:outer membrane murein-binding lipoprotein Lpp
MSENRDPLVLEFLLRLNAKVDGLTGDLRDLRHRVTRLEQQLAALEATEAIHHAATRVALDRLQSRLDRIERGPTATDRSANE